MALRATIWIVSCMAECAYEIDAEKDDRTRRRLRRLYEETFRKRTAFKWLAAFCGGLVAASGFVLVLAALTCMQLEQPVGVAEIVPPLVPIMIAALLMGSALFEIALCTSQGRLRRPSQLKPAADWFFVVLGDASKAASSIKHGGRKHADRTTLVNVGQDDDLPGLESGDVRVSLNLGADAFSRIQDDDSAPMHMSPTKTGEINIPMQELNSQL
jgi:hypothetical protein